MFHLILMHWLRIINSKQMVDFQANHLMFWDSLGQKETLASHYLGLFAEDLLSITISLVKTTDATFHKVQFTSVAMTRLIDRPFLSLLRWIQPQQSRIIGRIWSARTSSIKWQCLQQHLLSSLTYWQLLQVSRWTPTKTFSRLLLLTTIR